MAVSTAMSVESDLQGWKAVLPWVWAVFVGLSLTFFATQYFDELGGDLVDAILLPLGAFAMSALGALVSTRAPGNRISWLFYIVGANFVVELISDLVVGETAPHPVTLIDVLAIIWSNSGYFLALVIPVVLLLFVFPTGQLLSPRWNWVRWLTGVVVLALIAAEWFATDIGPDGAGWTVNNPFGFVPTDGLDDEGLLSAVFGFGLIALMVTGPICMVLRYRRAEPEGRAQIKWVAFSLLLFPLNFIVGSIPALEPMSSFVFVTTFSLVPLTIAIAITRYRLYEIDRIISRTISYAVVIGILIGAFFVVVAGLTTLLPAESSLAVAASTLLVAALFNPVRLSVQRWVDRRFNRARYEAQTVVEGFTGSIQHETDVDSILSQLTEAASEAISPRVIGTWDNTGLDGHNP